MDLVGELRAETVGNRCLVETDQPRQKLVREYCSLIVLDEVDVEKKLVRVRPSDWVAALSSGREQKTLH